MEAYEIPEEERCRPLGKPQCSCMQRTKKTCEEHDRRGRKFVRPQEDEEEDVVILQRSQTTTCTVNLHGATVTSWRIDNEEQLFVGKRSHYHPHFPIRGGASLSFPFFDDWSFGPRYGVARKIRWRLLFPPGKLPSGDVQAAFIVCDDTYTRAQWVNNFWLCFWLILRASALHVRYFVFNTNNVMPFECTPMLMMTLRLRDVTNCAITGVKGCEYSDDFKAIVYEVEQNEHINIQTSIQRLYYNTPDLVLYDPIPGRTITFIKDLPDTEIWNPWEGDKSNICFYTQVVEEVDFYPNDYLNMLRISCGHVRKPITLNPNEYFIGHLVIQVDKTPEAEYLEMQRKSRTSRVLPEFARDSSLREPQLPRFSPYLVPALQRTTAFSHYTSPSLTDIPYMIAEEIFSEVTKKDIPYMMPEDLVSKVIDRDDERFKLAEDITSQVVNKLK